MLWGRLGGGGSARGVSAGRSGLSGAGPGAPGEVRGFVPKRALRAELGQEGSGAGGASAPDSRAPSGLGARRLGLGELRARSADFAQKFRAALAAGFGPLPRPPIDFPLVPNQTCPKRKTWGSEDWARASTEVEITFGRVRAESGSNARVARIRQNLDRFRTVQLVCVRPTMGRIRPK